MLKTKRVLVYLCILGVFLTLLAGVSHAQEDDDDEGDQYYGVSTEHNAIRDATPRFLGNKEFDPGDRNWDATDYALSVGSTMFYGIFLALLALIIAILWICWRVCKCAMVLCKCCFCCCIKARNRKPSGKEDDAKKNLMLMLVGLLIMLCTWSTVCLVYNTEISDALFDDKGMFQVARNLLNGGNAIVHKISADILDIIAEIVTNIDEIILLVVTAPEMFEGGPEAIESAVDDIVQALYDSETFTVRSAVTESTVDFSCLVCTATAEEVNTTGYVAIEEVRQMIDFLNETIIETTDELIEQREVIVTGLNDTIYEILDEIDAYVEEANDGINDAEDYTETYDSYRMLGVACLYVFPFIGVIILAVAFYLKSSKLVQINIFPFWISWFFVSLLMAIHFPLAVVVGDSCTWISGHEQTFGGEVGKVRDVCLNGDPVDVIYNFTEYIEFRNNIDVNLVSQSEIDTLFEFTDFEDVRTEISNFDYTEWVDTGSYGSFADIDNNIDIYNTAYESAIVFVTRENGTSDDAYNAVVAYSGGDEVAAETAYDNFAIPLQLEEQIDALVGQINASFDEFDEFMDTLEQNVTDLAYTVNNLDDSLEPIFDSVDALIVDFDCSIIGDAYMDFKDVFCDRIGGSVTYICLFSFLLIVTVIPTMFLFCVVASAITDQNKANKFFANEDYSVSASEMHDTKQGGLSRPESTEMVGKYLEEEDEDFMTMKHVQ